MGMVGSGVGGVSCERSQPSLQRLGLETVTLHCIPKGEVGKGPRAQRERAFSPQGPPASVGRTPPRLPPGHLSQWGAKVPQGRERIRLGSRK